KMGAIDDMTRNRIINGSDLYGKYETEIDNESAYEMLQEEKRKEELALKREQEIAEKEKQWKKEEKEREQESKAAKKKGNQTSYFQKVTSSAVTSIGRELGRQFVRGLMGSLKK
ncbi:MAG TPA: DUF853 domain-containing protein, partial [Ruminiclostridium sp.]|nr:DUF853 domain-containing protein [Ruminiclostridium sp.]